MWKYVKLAIIINLFFINICHANDKYLDFTLGILSTFAIHESSHELILLTTGTNHTWQTSDRLLEWRYNEKLSKDTGISVSIAGLIGQSIYTEILISDNKKTSFKNGAILFHVLNTTFYSLKYFYGDDFGDIYELGKYTNKETASIFAITNAAVSLWQGYRYYKNDNNIKKFNLIPYRDGGIISFDFNF